ncbi:MAG: lyase family protein [Candidatus Peregrinibacteria bacterium]
MAQKLWQTGSALHPLVEAFTVGDDSVIDQKLIPYDIQASIAHAKMLARIGVLSPEEYKTAEQGLQKIYTLWENGKFMVQKAQEDGHTAIEQFLTTEYGEVGKKIHTGRSRNDQSLVMVRLFAKAKLKTLQELLNTLIKIFAEKKQEGEGVVMPGYTHTQKAMPTTVFLWLESFQHGFEDMDRLLESVAKMIDQNPLGSAAGFGVPHLVLDRDFTTKELGFAKTQENPLYCALSRGFFENIILQSLSGIMILSARFASDMIFFTAQETAFFALPDAFVTGSSIMPQKKNYDLFEIMRGNVRVFTAFQQSIQNIIASLGSGYHRDLQLTKKPFVDGIELAESTLQLLIAAVPEIIIHHENLKNALTDDLFLTEKVYQKVANGECFRDAYQEVKREFFGIE